MKCVCPSGGDRTCPDNCLLAVWHSLPLDQRTKERRRPMVEALAKQGYTQEAIALQLGVSVMTVSRDLETFNTMLNVKGQGKDTRGRKRSTGRPKGSTKSGSTASGRRRIKELTPEVEHKVASAVLDQGMSLETAVAEAGVGSVQQAKIAVAYERGRREAEPTITPDMLSMSAQQKFDAAIRQHNRKTDLEFETRVRDEVKRRIDEIVLPHWKEKIEKAQELYSRRKGLMDKDTFNMIRRALHPDSRQSISDKKLGEAFDAFMALEKFLLNEKESPTEFPDLPNTWADWEKAKQRATAERRVRRGHSAVRVR